jgi:serine/threonine protein kinase
LYTASNNSRFLSWADCKAIALHNITGNDHINSALVTEYFEGQTLKQLIQSNKQLHLTEYLQLFIELADILHIVHSNNVIHCDLSTNNILFNQQTKEVQLIDFEVARISKTNTSQLIKKEAACCIYTCIPAVPTETIGYISPEATGRVARRVDNRADLYGLGVIMYELLTGRLPFLHTDPIELIYAIVTVQPQSPKSYLQLFNSDNLCPIIMELLSKHADQRYQSAFGLKEDLQTLLKRAEVQ